MTLKFPVLPSRRPRLLQKRMESSHMKNWHFTLPKNKKMIFKKLVCSGKRLYEDEDLNLEICCSTTYRNPHPFRGTRPRKVIRYTR